MEYFRIIKLKITEDRLQESIVLDNLDEISTVIFNLNVFNEEVSEIGGIWGEFTLHRSKIKGGIRFALLECPYAFCWTITTGNPPDRESIVIHLSVNRTEISLEFKEEIEAFLDDHCLYLEKFLSMEQTGN